MNKTLHITPLLTTVLLTATLLLAACADDPDTGGRTLSVSLGSRQFADIDQETTTTRAVSFPAPTTDWEDYTTLNPGATPNMLLFIANSKDNPTSSDVTSRLLRFQNNYNKDWQANVTITDPSSTYLLYGFIPLDADNASDQVSITRLLKPNDTYEASYSTGAILTIRGLKAVTMSDPCVIVGAKKLNGKDDNVTLQQGTFSYQFSEESEGSITDYACMLLDHLYSRYYFEFKMNATYAALRTIRIKKLSLEALDLSGTNAIRSVNATVTLRANTTGDSPIEGITFQSNNGNRSVTFYDNENDNDNTKGRLNATTYESFGFCLASPEQRWFRLTTTYDVLDSKGVVIRSDDVAVNSFDTQSIKTKILNRAPGVEHKIQITVNPTYLHTLSETDWDQPNFIP